MRHLILLLSMISVFMSTAYLPLKQMYTPSKELTESEKAGLLLMREEEKLAFEVYTTMYKNGITMYFTIYCKVKKDMVVWSKILL
ncbi:MAG: DUF2202 domain-containing protein [Saprospiraceae bacterium]|nr:DUF2202 domain-containing protein [Saprospiraceae bacterium]MBK8819647.1 DUF2202 domain-containing protein [Saprospiraceae bacterium]